MPETKCDLFVNSKMLVVVGFRDRFSVGLKVDSH